MPIQWNAPEFAFSRAQSDRINGFRDWLRKSKLKLARELADPLDKFTVTKSPKGRKEMQRLEKALILDRTSTSAAHMDSQILLKFVAFQNRMGANLPVPHISTLFTLPSNPFSGDVVRALEQIRDWKRVEREWIKGSGANQALELIVFSAMLHGGLLHRDSISAFARVLLNPAGKMGYAGHQITVALDLAWNGLPKMEFRSWRPDILTACAIAPPTQLSSTPSLNLTDKQLCHTIFQEIVKQMKSAGTPKELRPQSLKQMIDAIALVARTEIPAILVDYATRQVVSHSVRPDVLRRIYSQPQEDASLLSQTKAPVLDDGLEGVTIFLDPSERENPDDQEPIGLKHLRAALNVKSAEAALAGLRRLLAEIETHESVVAERHSIWYLITQFAEYLLSRRQVIRPGTFFRRNLALSSAKAYAVNLVGRRFGRLLEGKDVLILNATDFEDYYTQAIENSLGDQATRRQRRALVSALREFHDFLVLEHNAPPVQNSELFGAVRGLLPVDATIITLEEYQKSRRIIRSDIHRVPDLRVRQIAEAMLIIGFKCGARRMEAKNLSIADLLLKGEPWLIIRPWDDHALKTINAKRQIPLRSLLGRSEFKVLRRCLEGARALSEHNKYLFGIPDNAAGCRVIPEDTVMPIIHRALREATNDKRIRFHHCRHSFATWTLLRLMLSDLETIPDLFPHLKQTQAWLKGCKRFRRLLYAGDGNQTRRHVRTVSSLLGHSGPLISLEHYIHCLDWLLPHFLSSSKLLGKSDARDIATLADRAASGVYSAMAIPDTKPKRTKPDPKVQAEKQDADETPKLSLPIRIFRARFPDLAPLFETRVEQPGKPDETSVPSLLDHWAVLFLHQTTQESLHSLAERFGFETADVHAMIERVHDLRSIEEPRGKRVKRHKALFSSNDADAKNPKLDLLHPIRPRPERSEMFIRDLEDPLMVCARQHSTLVKRVLTYYVNNIWSSENVLVFRNPKEPQSALDYLTFLKELGFGNPGKAPIRFVSFDDADVSETRNDWQKVLGIIDAEWDKVEKRGPVFESYRTNRRWLSIGPHLDSDEDEAYRFLMILAAIAYGFTPQPARPD